MRTTAIRILLGFSAALCLCAQETSKRPAFAVASIKPVDRDSGETLSVNVEPNGTLTASDVWLKLLIRIAYNVEDVQISGGPGWITTEKFDIRAKPEEGAKVELRAMLQSLLEDRFRLAVRRQTRVVPVYEMRIAKAGRGLGPSLRASETGDCPPGPPPPLDRTKPAAGCGAFLLLPGRLFGNRVPLSNLVSPLSQIVGQPVIDKTGIGGKYDVTLEWSADRNPGGPGEQIPAGADGPSIFTAVQEQLGLKLEPAKGPVELLVIDHVELPSPN